MTYIYLISSALLNGIAQIVRKIGLKGFDDIPSIHDKIIFLLKNYYFLGGVILYGISIVLWFYILSKLEVSFAYPFIALSYIVVLIGGYFLGEHIGGIKIAGIGLILLGILLISKG